MADIILPKRFVQPIIHRPVDDSIKLWISGKNRDSNTRIRDLSKSGNVVTIVGATWMNTPLNQSCLKLDGIDDYISVANSSSIHIVRNYTWLFWMNMDSLAVAEVLISDRLDPDPFCYQVYTSINTGVIRLYAKTTAGSVLEIASSINAKITTGEWGLYSITRKATNVVFSKNNLFETISIVNDVGETNTRSVVFGVTYASGADNWFPGKFGDIRLYNRPLSTNEISDIYEQTKHLYGL